MRFALFSAALICLATIRPAMADEAYLRLVDRLDRPSDGYCVDVLGSGGAFRVDMPLMAHNCKPGRAPDEVLIFQDNGRIYFPAYEACLTAMGVNRSLMAGAALMLKPCGAQIPFLNAANFQSFEHRADGRLALQGRDLCLRVGASSDRTFSSRDVWRTLFVDDCASAPASLSTWEFTEPYF